MGTEPDPRLHDPTLTADPLPLALKILVAEDNLTNQKLILRQLKSLGYIADLVSDGQAAIDATAENFYQIVLMDCRLPKVDGYTATRLIRQREQIDQPGKTIIIALTASDDSEAESEARAAGMDDFLTKPLRRETLAATLKKWGQLLQHECDRSPIPAELTYQNSLPNSTLLALHFDLDRLHQLSDCDQAFERELLQLYLDDTQAQVQQLLQASSKQNFLQIEQTAHHIRGASASVGAIQLEAISTKLEQQAQQKLSTTLNLVEQLEQAFEQVQILFQEKV